MDDFIQHIHPYLITRAIKLYTGPYSTECPPPMSGHGWGGGGGCDYKGVMSNAVSQ